MTVSNKTKPTDIRPEDYIRSLDDSPRRDDGLRLLELMQDETGVAPRMWGPSMIGFGSYHYKYASGREGDALKVGFSPRKNALVLYGLVFYDENEPNNKLLERLGPHNRGKGCLYIRSLKDIDTSVLRQMISNSYARGDYDATA